MDKGYPKSVSENWDPDVPAGMDTAFRFVDGKVAVRRRASAKP